MKRDFVDFFHVEPHQLAIHDRLLNWARWVKPRIHYWEHPMWRQGKSNARQWHAPVISDQVDSLDGQAMEKMVAALPDKHRSAIRWCYVECGSPIKIRQKLGLTGDGLRQMVRDARQMLVNRCCNNC